MNEITKRSTEEDEKNPVKVAESTNHATGTDPGSPRRRHQRRSSDLSTQDDNACKESPSEIDKIGRWRDSLNQSMISLPSRQHIASLALQISAIVAAIAFGSFAVQSVHLANQANQYAAAAANLSLASNQMAMYAICVSSQLQVCCTGWSRSILVFYISD